MREFVREYLLLSKKERNGLFVLVVILLSVIVLPIIYTGLFPPEPDDFEVQLAYIKKGTVTEVESYTENELFDFDPNIASASDLENLGISDKAIQHIYNYRNKGGVFYSRDDLLKINDISKDDYFKLRKYIKIQRANNYHVSNTSSNKTTALRIDLNKADSTQLIQLKGIGPVYAGRIVKYRNSIGGFSSVEELTKVYGIDDELVSKIRPFLILGEKPEAKTVNNSTDYIGKGPRKLMDLNKADTLELIKLKGIGPAFSRRIFKYRDLLGGFVHVGQLHEVYGLPPETIASIASEINIDTDNIRKVSLNKATYNEMAAHPYINKLLAEYIIKYRSSNPFIAITDIKNSFLVDEELYRKLAPYLEI